MKKIKAIVTDLDGVLRKFPDSRNTEIERKYSLPLGSLMNCAFKHSDLDLAVRGKITDKEWRKNISRRLLEFAPNTDTDEIILEWSDFAGIVNTRVLDIYRAKKENRPLVLMTNATDKLNEDLKTLDIQDEFDFIINASEVGYAKPDAEIFNYALTKLSLDSSEVVFIDDSEKIIAKAKELGFCTHQYSNFDNFRDFCERTL